MTIRQIFAIIQSILNQSGEWRALSIQLNESYDVEKIKAEEKMCFWRKDV